jgi:tetratricopeptide (TPR) repeat protein
MAKNIIKVPKKQLSRLQLGIYISVVVIILVAVYFFFKPYFTDDPWNNVKIPSAEVEDVSTKYREASKLASNGKYSEGMKVLDDLFATAKTDELKSQIYMRKSNLASDTSRIDDALDFAKKAEDLYPTRLSAATLGRAAEAMLQPQLALKYYKLVIERTTDSERKVDPTINDDYDQKIKDLSK